MNNRKSYFLIAIVLIAVTTCFVSCRGGGARGAAAAAGAKIIHEAVESFEEDEPSGSGSNVSFRGKRKCTYPIGSSTCSKLGKCSGLDKNTESTCKNCIHDASWHK